MLLGASFSMGSTYIIHRKEFSEVAFKKYGNGWIWRFIISIRQRPPSSEVELHCWLWNLVKKWGAGHYKMMRTQAKGEKAGFHPCWLGYVDQDYMSVDRRYTQYKGIPSLPHSRDLFFKRSKKERTRFSKRGMRRF